MGTYERFVEEIKATLEYDENPEVLREVTKYGADAGWPGLSYDDDLQKWYDEYQDVIWDIMCQDAEEYGYSSPLEVFINHGRNELATSHVGFIAAVVWYAVEWACARCVQEHEE